MDEKEFQRQVKNEMKTGVPNAQDAQFSKVMQAFGERQAHEAQKAGKSKRLKKIFSARNLSIFAATAAAMVLLIVSAILWPKDESTKVYFNSDTPHLIFSSFEEIKEHTDADVKLPIGFDEGYDVMEMKVYYIEENKPCAIEISYQKPITEMINARIKITITLTVDVLFYEESNYNRCNIQDAINGTNYVYSLQENEQESICMAKFKINGKDYFYDAFASNESTLVSLILSLE